MTPLDVLVGERIRKRRQQLGMTQTELAEKIDVRFQQVQKYENGQNRVAASRLWRIAETLQVTVNYFFEDIAPETDAPDEHAIDSRRKRELVDLFTELSERQQAAVMSFLRSVANPPSK